MCHKSARHNHSSRDLGKNTYYPATNTLIRMKMATLVRRPPVTVGHKFTNQYKFLSRYTRSLLHNLATRLFCILRHNFMFSAVFQPPCVVQKMCLSVQGPKCSFISWSTCCLLKLHLLSTVTTIHWNFLQAPHDCTLSPYSLTGLCTCFPIWTTSPCAMTLYICTSDSTQFNFHSVQLPYVGHLSNSGGLEENEKWPT
jgi:hypothetical protein